MACAASLPRRLTSPLPLPGRNSPCSLASSPGAVSVRLPLPPRAAGWASSWPLNSASSVRIRSDDKTSVPPAWLAFQLPLAVASRRRNCRKELLLPEVCAVSALAVARTLASKPSAAPWLRKLAWPSSGKPASRLCSAAGLTCCSLACSFQGGAAVAAALIDGANHSPLASSEPPPNCAFNERTIPMPFSSPGCGPFRHSPRASRRSRGSRRWSQAPGNRLASCSCIDHDWLARLLEVGVRGRTLALPVSMVCGASGEIADRSRSEKLASATSSGCAAHGAIWAVRRAVTLAWGGVDDVVLPAAGVPLTCKAALTCSSLKGPRAVASKASANGVFSLGITAAKLPDKLASSISGLLATKTARPR